jgi:hypothetical protein
MSRIMEFFLCVIGMVMIIEGIPYFGFPDKMKELMSYVQSQDDGTLRALGATLMIMGLLIIYFARRGLLAS